MACGPTTTATGPIHPLTPPAESVPVEPPPTGIRSEELAAELDEYVASFGVHWGEAYRFSGFILVVSGGRNIYEKGFGMADRSTRSVPTADTTFRIGSVTKQFTAAAILELQEQGKLSLDDTVRKHLPSYPVVGDRITVHQLLTHTAGVWNYTTDDDWARTHAATPHTTAQLLATFKDQPLDFEPGEEFRYSNSGYVLLGAIVEAASSKGYGDFVAQELFAAAGLNRTTYGDAAQLGDVARGYTIAPDERVEPAEPVDMSVPHAAGAIRSTANDLATWHRALAGEQILSEASKAKLYRAEKSNYAYGWVVDTVGGHQRVSHNGGINGFESYYARLPDEDIVVVAWTNHEGFPLDEVGEAAVRFAVGEPVPPHEETPSVALRPAAQQRIAGGYVLTPEARELTAKLGLPPEIVESFAAVDLRIDGDHMMLDPIGDTSLRVFASGPTTLFTKYPHLEISVELAPGGGAASGITVSQGGLEVTYTRDDHAAQEARAALAERRKGK